MKDSNSFVKEINIGADFLSQNLIFVTVFIPYEYKRIETYVSGLSQLLLAIICIYLYYQKQSQLLYKKFKSHISRKIPNQNAPSPCVLNRCIHNNSICYTEQVIAFSSATDYPRCLLLTLADISTTRIDRLVFIKSLSRLIRFIASIRCFLYS